MVNVNGNIFVPGLTLPTTSHTKPLLILSTVVVVVHPSSLNNLNDALFLFMMMRRGRARFEALAFFRRKGRIYRIALGTVGFLLCCSRISLLNVAVSSTDELSFFLEAGNQANRCYTDECVDKLALKLSRVWRPHSHHYWCADGGTPSASAAGQPHHHYDANSTGLWLIKVPKSASSTVAGLVLRIAELHDCPVRWQHAKAIDVLARHSNNTNQTNRQQTFLVAPIRNPRSRALSSVYFHSVSLQPRPANRRNRQPADAHVVRQLERVEDDFISDYTRVSSTRETTEPWRVVQEILETYHFLLVVENMEASLVVLAWLADLGLSDVLVMSSKTAGSWYATNRGKCVPLVPPQVTPAVETYWQTSGRRRHYTDRLLHAAARHSLHRTIVQGMGEEVFTRQLQKFRNLQAYAQSKCGVAMNESAPCSPTGVYQPQVATRACYLRDFGCGHSCLEQLFSSWVK